MHRLYQHFHIVFRSERDPHPDVIIRDDIHAGPDGAVVGVHHVDGRQAAAEVDAVDLDTHGAARVQAHGFVVVHAFRVVAGHCAQGHGIADAAFDEGADVGIRQREFQVGVDGQRVEVGLLHVVEQVAVLAVGRIELRADADAGEATDLVLRHTAYAEVIGDIVRDDGAEVVVAELAVHVETEVVEAVEARRATLMGLLQRSGMGLWTVWTDLCLGRNRHHNEEAQG